MKRDATPVSVLAIYDRPRAFPDHVYLKNSDGCGHYTQVVWRKSTDLGCGFATCSGGGGFVNDIWICNYAPAGNSIG
jgi:pathogenesis-related protein 1